MLHQLRPSRVFEVPEQKFEFDGDLKLFDLFDKVFGFDLDFRALKLNDRSTRWPIAEPKLQDGGYDLLPFKSFLWSKLLGYTA